MYHKLCVTAGMLMCVSASSLSARDVNLDAIYLKKSPVLSRIHDAKLDLFARAGAAYVQSGVSFAGWRSGDSLVFCIESDDNTGVYEFYLPTRAVRFLTRVDGVPLCASVSARYLYLKTARVRGIEVIQRFCVIDLSNGNKQSERVPQLFIDYSITPFGTSYMREGRDGVMEYFPDSARTRLVVPKSVYAGKTSAGQTVIPFLSPDGMRTAILIGGGGSYRALVVERGMIIREFGDVSSSVEFAWVDSSTVSYRSGGPGNYRMTVRSVDPAGDGTVRTIGRKTFNTNFSYCPSNGFVSFLQDGCVAFASVRSNELEVFPFEGEDVIFSPNGNNFISLYRGRLFVLSRETMKKRIIDMKRAGAKLLSIYREARLDRSLWENDFSSEYIDRKIGIYSRLVE
jgi:hypothetical protein